MADSSKNNKTEDSLDNFSREISKKEKRKIKARTQKKVNAVWFGLGMLGLVGWAVAVPTLIFLAIGIWLDSVTGGEISWTLTMIVIGVALGALNAWFWVKKESRHD